MRKTEGRRREEGIIEKRASRMMEGTTKGRRYEGVNWYGGINYGIGNILGTVMYCSAHIVIGLKLRTCNSPFRRNGNNTAISRPTALPGSIRRKNTVHT